MQLDRYKEREKNLRIRGLLWSCMAVLVVVLGFCLLCEIAYRLSFII